MRILIAGGFDSDDPQIEEMRSLCREVGRAVAGHGHTLLNGARTQLDALIAEAADDELRAYDKAERERRIVSYVLAGEKPIHQFGTIIKSQLTDWELGNTKFYVPEQVAQADVVVLIGGYKGTIRAANWAEYARKPLLPFASFGGAAATIYERELHAFEEKYGGRLERIEFEQLNSIKTWQDHAIDIVALAEKVAESRSALVVMSYANRADLKDAYGTFQRVCRDLGYACHRVDEKSASTRILPEILTRCFCDRRSDRPQAKRFL
jgi:hypothetical protein